MLFKDVGELVKLERSIAGGYPRDVKIRRTVFLNRKSVRQSEFYQARGQGIDLEAVFEIRSADLHGETELVQEGKTYAILRTYERTSEITELICSFK